jgi:formate hydrogenlyase subunit 3/multisubunit Na+/H+ antiporter MnhD subunit
MSDHQRETAFLRRCILYEDTVERHHLEARLTQAERDERCVRGAVWLMSLLTALALAGLCYSALFLADFPQNKSHLTLKVFGALGLGSIISLVAFAGFWGVHRTELDQRREECRRLAARLLESRLGQPHITPLQDIRDNRVEEGVIGAVCVANEGAGAPVPIESGARL